ncbi:MAG: transglycosylase SLT domain-containing protein [Patescibacteria group bacterium]
MRAACTFVAIVLSTVCASASTAPSTDRLIAALIEVESHGNDHAIGDKHMNDKAYGALQIRKPCVDDVNQRLGTKHRAEDMLGNRSLSVQVCRTYLERYATRKALGREPSLEDMARIWNGGPKGWRKQSTLGYWSKVQKALAKRQ